MVIYLKYIKPVFTIILLLTATVATTIVQSKPLPSLSVKMMWRGDVVQDATQAVTLSVFSHVTTNNLEISFSLPEGVIMLDGLKNVVTSIERSKPLEKTYTFQIDKVATGQIKAEVRINSSGQTSFYAAAALPVNTELHDAEISQKTSPRSPQKENFKRTQRNGEWLREYQLP